MVPLGESVKDEVPSDGLHPSENSNIESHASNETETPRNRVSTLQPDLKDNRPSIKVEKTKPVPDSANDTSRSNQGGKSSPRKPKKALQIPEPGAMALQSGQEVSTPSSIREKVSEDGYNWRKYGQKLVKGNEYIRSYYRCTHPNCLVKKQLERLHEGQIVDIVYFGQHAHPKPQVNVPVAVGFAVSIVAERRKEPYLTTTEDTTVDAQSPKTPSTKPVNVPQISNASAIESSKGTISQSNKSKDEIFSDDDPDSKRQKKDKDNLRNTAVDKPASEPRVVVQTRSEVDSVNDGYRWRKYGQKLVKGNPNPRSYYRCSNSGCPVKKHVERASHDPKVVITTYEGRHSHGAPPARIVTYNVPGSSDSPTAHNGESGANSDGNAACLDMVVDAILEHESKSEKQVKSELPSRSAASDSKPNKQQKSKLVVKEESDPIRGVPVESRTNNNLDVQPSIRSEGNNSCVVDMVVHDSIKTEVQNPDSEPVQG